MFWENCAKLSEKKTVNSIKRTRRIPLNCVCVVCCVPLVLAGLLPRPKPLYLNKQIVYSSRVALDRLLSGALRTTVHKVFSEILWSLTIKLFQLTDTLNYNQYHHSWTCAHCCTGISSSLLSFVIAERTKYHLSHLLSICFISSGNWGYRFWCIGIHWRFSAL